MSIKISTGTKKKSYGSIMDAARVVAAKTGEPLDRVYIRMYKRMENGVKPVTAMNAKPRKYVRKEQTAEQVGA